MTAIRRKYIDFYDKWPSLLSLPGVGSAASEDQSDALRQIGNPAGEEADYSHGPVPLFLLAGGWGFGFSKPHLPGAKPALKEGNMGETKSDGHMLRDALDDFGLSQTGFAKLMKGLGDNRDEKNILRSIQRMIAGEARVSGEVRALLGTIPRLVKPFEFELTGEEAEQIAGASGTGGHQSLHRRLCAQLEKGHTLLFNDQELGELIRYMTRYGSGGFQSRLRRAFSRSFREMVAPVLDAEQRC